MRLRDMLRRCSEVSASPTPKTLRCYLNHADDCASPMDPADSPFTLRMKSHVVALE